MATYTVTNSNDLGAGSLREAIEQANITPGEDIIQFSGVSSPIILTSGKLTITDALTINGTGIIVSGNNQSRVFDIDDLNDNTTLTVTLDGLTIQNGSDFEGGGIFNAEKTTLINSTIRQNTSINDNGDQGVGGGIINDALGTLIIQNSTISGNQASSGAGIYNSGQLTILNSTISGNVATEKGGGIYNYSSATIINNTIADNLAASGGGLYNYSSGTLNLRNTIIARNSDDLVTGGTITPDNIIENSDGLKLSSTLENNGGSTLTYSLMSGSSAINTGNNDIANASGITTDQRGQNRDGRVDIGAYEFLDTSVPEDFDPAQYGASHRDLINTFGYDLAALTAHYLNHGMAEGRSRDNFDEFRYIASSYVGGGDLINVYGLNGARATEHYIRYGYNENRSLRAFEPARYINSYDDLLNASSIGTNTLAATQHFITNGFAPDRRDPSLFPSDRYLASYGDLINTFAPITDYAAKVEAASNHYLFNGRGEGRLIRFDPAVYLSNNPDVAVDPFYSTAPTRHYIEYGYFEGRMV